MRRLLYSVFFILLAVSAYPKGNKIYNIGLLGDIELPNSQKGFLDDLKYEIISVVGSAAEIEFNPAHNLINNENIALAKQNLEKLINNPNVDVIIAFGPVNQYIISKYDNFPKPIILFGVTYDDFICFPNHSESSGISNLNYVITPMSLKKDLKEFYSLRSFEKIGILYDEVYDQIYPMDSTFNAITSNLECEYDLIPYTNLSDLDSHLNNVDALYIMGGLIMELDSSQYHQLTERLIDYELPSFAALNANNEDNTILLSTGIGTKKERVIRRIAIVVEAIIEGKDIGELPVHLDTEEQLTVNMTTAHKIGFSVRYSDLNKMHIVGNIEDSRVGKHYDLESVFSQVLNQNVTLSAKNKNIDISNKDFRLARSEYLPEITTSFQGSYFHFGDIGSLSDGGTRLPFDPDLFSDAGNTLSLSFKATLQQVLYDQKASSNIKIQKFLEEASKNDYDTEELNTLLDASNAYFNTLMSKTNYLINDENLKVTQANYNIANQNFEAGQSGKSDVLRWESELATAKQGVVVAYTKMNQSYNSLNEVLNNPIGTEIRLDDPNISGGMLEKYNYKQLFYIIDDPILSEKFEKILVHEAIEKAPELASIISNISAIDYTAKMYQRSKFVPTVGVQGTYSRSIIQNNDIIPRDLYTVGVGVSLPIIDKNQRTLNRNKALVQKEQLELQQEATKLTISRTVKDLLNSLVSQVSNITLSQVSAKAAKESLELMQVAYSNGAVSITSLIDAQQAYIQAEQNEANANYNYLLVTIQIERMLGYYFLMHTEEENKEYLDQHFLELFTK